MASSQRKILIIEDALEIRTLLKRLLERKGFSVECAGNGIQALNVLADCQALPGLILLDIMMPVMDGFEFRIAQKADRRLAQVPVVVMTADGNIESNKSRLGVAELLNKPLDAKILLNAVETWYSDGIDIANNENSR